MNKGTQEKLAETQNAMDLEEDEVTEVFEEVLDEMKDQHPDMKNADLELRAARRVYLKFKRDRSSGGNPIEGIIVSCSDPVDLNAKKIRDAKELFRKNPGLAVKRGITDEEGTPLDTVKSWGKDKNANFGKPIPTHKWRYIINGLFTWPDQDQPELCTMFVPAGEGPSPPVFKRVKFSGYPPKEGTNTINITKGGSFQVQGDVDVSGLVKKFLEDNFSDLAGLEDFADTHDEYELVCVEGDVTSMWMSPDEGKSRNLVIEDDSIGFDEDGTFVWLPDWVTVDFLEDSRVIVFGKVSIGDRGASIQAGGVYAIPQFKVAAADVDEFEEDDFEEDDDE